MISFAISNKTGIVRRPLIIPPIPRVSAIVCFNPNSLGILKSIIVDGSYPPTWIVVWTKSAPIKDSRLFVWEVTLGEIFNFFEITSITSCDAFNLTGSMSCNAISIFLNCSIAKRSVTILLVKTALPAPIIVSLIILILHDWIMRCHF